LLRHHLISFPLSHPKLSRRFSITFIQQQLQALQAIIRGQSPGVAEARFSL
jgi:hypothetical protein